MPHPEEIQVPKEYQKLSEIEGIALSAGLDFCGSWKAYELFLDGFYEEIDERASEIEDAYARGDIEFYTIKVHSLKTVSRVIGAEAMAKLAESLEKAGESGDKQFMEAHTTEVLELLRSYKGRLYDYMHQKELARATLEPISDSELMEAYGALREVVPDMDYDAVEMILEELKKYRLPEEHQIKINNISDHLRHLRWDEIEDLL